MKQKKILLLLDGSEDQVQLEQYALQLKQFKKVQIVFFHILTGLPECFWDMQRIPQTQNAISELIGWETRQEERITSFMKNVRKIFADLGIADNLIDTKIQKFKTGIARDIIEEIELGDYTAVMFKRQGVGYLERLSAGSVANKLLAKTSFCPLLIVGHLPTSQRVLMAIDSSPSSKKAVDFIAENLDGVNAAVGLVHVIRGVDSFTDQDPDAKIIAGVIAQTRAKILEEFHNIKEKLTSAGFSEERIEGKIISGASSRAMAIIEEAAAGQYDTIVVGRKGLSQVEDFIMGRVSHKIIHTDKRFSVWII